MSVNIKDEVSEAETTRGGLMLCRPIEWVNLMGVVLGPLIQVESSLGGDQTYVYQSP